MKAFRCATYTPLILNYANKNIQALKPLTLSYLPLTINFTRSYINNPLLDMRILD